MQIKNIIFHLFAYYIAWFSCIFVAAQNHGWYAFAIVLSITFLQILWQIFFIKKTQGLCLMLGLFTLSGFIIDTCLIKYGLIHFSGNPFDNTFSPPWMVLLWTNFAVIFFALFESFFKRYILVGFLSFISFPLAYAIGVKMGAAQLPYGYFSGIIIGIIWAILFPMCLKIYNYLEPKDV